MDRRPGFCPKGLSDGSGSTELAEVLAVYCQGIQETEPVSAQADMIGSEGTFPNLEW